MLLCKVLQGSASEVGGILAGKWGVKHTGAELDAMSEVAKSAKNRCKHGSRLYLSLTYSQARLLRFFAHDWTNLGTMPKTVGLLIVVFPDFTTSKLADYNFFL